MEMNQGWIPAQDKMGQERKSLSERKKNLD